MVSGWPHRLHFCFSPSSGNLRAPGQRAPAARSSRKLACPDMFLRRQVRHTLPMTVKAAPTSRPFPQKCLH
eukprot:5393525-Pyramimonas_sp.AAC.1